MLPLEMSGGESSEREKEGAKSEQERQRRMRKRSETKTGLNVGGITEVWGSGEEGGVDIGAFPGSSGRYSALEDEKQFSFLAPWMRKGYGQDATPK